MTFDVKIDVMKERAEVSPQKKNSFDDDKTFRRLRKYSRNGWVEEMNVS